MPEKNATPSIIHTENEEPSRDSIIIAPSQQHHQQPSEQPQMEAHPKFQVEEPPLVSSSATAENSQLYKMSSKNFNERRKSVHSAIPSAFVANRITSNFGSNSALLKFTSSSSLLPTEVDPQLKPSPRRIPFTLALRVLTGGSSYVHIFFFLCLINGLIQGFLNCLEILCFLPMVVWGLVTLFSQLWKFDLLRNGVACIPSEGIISEEPGTTCICCGFNSIITSCGGGLQSGSGCIAYGGWNVKFGKFKREPVKVTTLEHVTDVEKGTKAVFSFASLPYRNSVVIYNPKKPKKYVHVKDLPFELVPNEKGEWSVDPKSMRSHIILTTVNIAYWTAWAGSVAWLVLVMKNIKLCQPSYFL